MIDGVPGNTIGGRSLATRNVISGNTERPHDLRARRDGNLVQGNYIGTNTTGTNGLANAGNGVAISGSLPTRSAAPRRRRPATSFRATAATAS